MGKTRPVTVPEMPSRNTLADPAFSRNVSCRFTARVTRPLLYAAEMSTAWFAPFFSRCSSVSAAAAEMAM